MKDVQQMQSRYRLLLKKFEELKRERGELQKKLEQHRGVRAIVCRGVQGVCISVQGCVR